MTIYAKLLKVQNELKVGKNQYNKFGNYNFRNVEDILNAVKPLLAKHNITLMMKDDILPVNHRFYIQATAILIDCETGEKVETTALAREEEESKNGMSASQLTGSSSSYARKYALNALFLIDDVKDADSTNTHGKEEEVKTKPVAKEPVRGGENVTPKMQNNQFPSQVHEETKDWLVTTKTLNTLLAMASSLGYTEDTLNSWALQDFQKPLRELMHSEAQHYFKTIKSHQNRRVGMM